MVAIRGGVAEWVHFALWIVKILLWMNVSMGAEAARAFGCTVAHLIPSVHAVGLLDHHRRQGVWDAAHILGYTKTDGEG